MEDSIEAESNLEDNKPRGNQLQLTQDSSEIDGIQGKETHLERVAPASSPNQRGLVISTLEIIEKDLPNEGGELNASEAQGIKDTKDEISWIHVISAMRGPLLTWAVASTYCYIPIHEVLKEPTYWYEHDLVTIVATLPTFLGITMLQGKYWAKFTYKDGWKSFLYLYGIGVLIYGIFAIGYHTLWTNVLNYNPPMPFHWYTSGTVAVVTVYFCNWFRLSEELKKTPNFKKRYLWYLGIPMVLGPVAWGHSLLGTAFSVVPVEYQWTLALVCPVVREIFVWGLLEVSYRAAGSKYRNSYEVTFPATHYMESKQSVFYCVTLASITPTTGYIIIATDFAINIYHGLKIVYKMKKTINPGDTSPINMEENEEVQRLVLTERIEAVIPLTYIVLIVMAYYGPNAENILGIKLTMWHLSAISDIQGFLTTLTLMLSIDFMSFIVNGILLWIFCKVNVMRVLQKIQKDFWFWMAVAEATIFLELFTCLAVGSGMDLTLTFEWVDGNNN